LSTVILSKQDLKLRLHSPNLPDNWGDQMLKKEWLIQVLVGEGTIKGVYLVVNSFLPLIFTQ